MFAIINCCYAIICKKPNKPILVLTCQSQTLQQAHTSPTPMTVIQRVTWFKKTTFWQLKFPDRTKKLKLKINAILSFKNRLYKYLWQNKRNNLLLRSLWWSPLTNKCLQGGAFSDNLLIQQDWNAITGTEQLIQTKQTLPIKLPGCFALAPITHQIHGLILERRC